MKSSDYLIETSPGEFFCFCFSAEKKTFFILVGKVPRVTPCWSQFGGGSAQGEPLLVPVWWPREGRSCKIRVLIHIMHDKPFRGAWNLDVLHFQRRQFGAAFVPNREGRLDN